MPACLKMSEKGRMRLLISLVGGSSDGKAFSLGPGVSQQLGNVLGKTLDEHTSELLMILFFGEPTFVVNALDS